MVSCRTGPLRVGRAFARLFTALRCPPVGRREVLVPTSGRIFAGDPAVTGIRVTK